MILSRVAIYMAFKLPKFTYPAYQYARHIEIMFQIDGADVDDHQSFLLYFAELLKRLPKEVNAIFDSDDLKQFTLRRVINLLRKYDGPSSMVLQHAAAEPILQDIDLQKIEKVDAIPMWDMHMPVVTICHSEMHEFSEKKCQL